jgi:hypothetical protein
VLAKHRTGNEAFFITQIGHKESPERKRADQVFDHIVRPVSDEFGIEVIRGDRVPTPGQITVQIVRSLIESTLVFADLTGRNPNVYYELGVVHSFGKPVIVLVDKATSLSFDTQNERVVTVGDAGEISVTHAEEAKKELRSVLEVVLDDDYKAENLITAVASSRSLDALAPRNPLASEIAALRDLGERTHQAIQALLAKPSSPTNSPDFLALRRFVEYLASSGTISLEDSADLITHDSSAQFDAWVAKLQKTIRQKSFTSDSPDRPVS